MIVPPVPTLLVSPLARARYEPIQLDEVEDALEALGIPTRVVESADHQSFDHDVMHETVQLAWAPPMLVSRVEPTVRTILTVVRAGRSGYRSALVGRKTEDLSPVSLSGKRAVWISPHSTAGYLLPIAFLRMLKQDTGRLFSEQRFVGTYRDALLAVAEGKTDVTSIYTSRAEDASVVKSMRELIGPDSNALAPIAFTDEVPADALVITSAVDAATAQAWTEKFLSLTSSHPLLKLLAAERLTRARDGDYRYLRTAVSLTRAGER